VTAKIALLEPTTSPDNRTTISKDRHSPVAVSDQSAAASHAPRTAVDLPGPIEKILLCAGWFAVERCVAVVLFFKTGKFY
jgi:hypothetical protein